MDSAEIIKRIEILEDIEAIKKLKSKYWRSVDTQAWDSLAKCFTDDVKADYGHIEPFAGKKEIMEYFSLRSRSVREPTAGVHQGHNPEIDIISDTAAKGIWQIFSYRINTQTGSRMRTAGFYYDDYAKENGEWKIKSTKIIHAFMENFDGTGIELTA